MGIVKIKLASGQIQKMKVPDDWSKDKIAEEAHKAFPEQGQSSMPQESANPEQQVNPDEGFPIQEKTGLTGLKSDFINSLMSAKKFANQIPENLSKISKDVQERPIGSDLHQAGQLAAALGNFGKGLINAPHDLNQYLARKHLLPQILGKIGGEVLPHIPEDTGVEKALGLEADPSKGDDLIRAIPEIASLVSGGGSAIKGIRNATKGTNLKQAIRDTQAKVNAATKNAGKIFDHVEREVESRGISKVLVDTKLLDQAKELLSNSLANRKLLQEAKKGDFTALRKLQGDLRNKGEKGLSSDDLANNDLGELMLETRDEINSSIQNHFENNGHKDLANALSKARKDYRTIQKTYHSTNKLSKTFGKDQFVPHNPITLLREESVQMKRLMEAHPELEKALSKALKQGKRTKNIKNAALALGGGSVGGAAYKYFSSK